jgi:hypothetical protein
MWFTATMPGLAYGFYIGIPGCGRQPSLCLSALKKCKEWFGCQQYAIGEYTPDAKDSNAQHEADG